MRRTAFLIASLVAAPAFAQAPAASNPAASSTKMVWGIMSGYFTKAAEQMPEADYSYKPVATVRTFGELVGHVAGAQYMFCAVALGETPKAEDAIEKTAKTKADLVAALKGSNEYCAKAYGMTDAAGGAMTKIFGMDMSKGGVLVFNASHVGEHYGNAVTYFRMKGMVPPSSQGQQ